jgi:hypothetical protein
VQLTRDIRVSGKTDSDIYFGKDIMPAHARLTPSAENRELVEEFLPQLDERSADWPPAVAELVTTAELGRWLGLRQNEVRNLTLDGVLVPEPASGPAKFRLGGNLRRYCVYLRLLIVGKCLAANEVKK